MDSARIIITRGMGGAFNPPTHPEYTMSVETELRRRPENRGGMSLSYAVGCAYIPVHIRAEARRILAEWVAPPINTPPVQLWITQVQRHWRGCYKGEGEKPWSADALHIHQPAYGAAPPRVLGTYPAPDTFCASGQHTLEDRADVHWIRQWYPAYMLAEGANA